MPTIIKETSTITAKGQTTVPKSVRQALGVGYGGKIVYRVEGGRVTLQSAHSEHRDPALGAFLETIRKDIARGRNMRDLPPDLVRTMRKAIKDVPVALDESLDGDAAI